MPIYLTVHKDGLEMYRSVINKCARCGAEVPVTSEKDGWLELTVWQNDRNDYCSEKCMSLYRA